VIDVMPLLVVLCQSLPPVWIFGGKHNSFVEFFLSVVCGAAVPRATQTYNLQHTRTIVYNHIHQKHIHPNSLEISTLKT
jgi:hypothetical protein